MENWKKCKLDQAPSLVLQMAITLPIAGLARFEAGIEAIENEAENIQDEFGTIFRFINDLKRIHKAMMQSISAKVPAQFLPYFHGLIHNTHFLRNGPTTSNAFISTYILLKKNQIRNLKKYLYIILL